MKNTLTEHHRSVLTTIAARGDWVSAYRAFGARRAPNVYGTLHLLERDGWLVSRQGWDGLMWKLTKKAMAVDL